jgi:CheY-like chemotaxis protein
MLLWGSNQFSVAAPLVLSVEDSDGDYNLMEFVLQQLGKVDLRRASDGEQALTFLKSSNKPRPDLILLDVNIPRKNGFDVLAFIKSQDSIRHIPVVIFTSSWDAREKTKALALGAEFVTKPNSLDGMVKVLNEICAKYLNGR